MTTHNEIEKTLAKNSSPRTNQTSQDTARKYRQDILPL